LARISKRLQDLVLPFAFLFAVVITAAKSRGSGDSQPQLSSLRLDRGGAASLDWPAQLPRHEPREADERSLGERLSTWLRVHAVDLAVVASLEAVIGTAHAWGMTRWPAFFDDEGTYVSQAWAVDKLHTLAPYTYWYDHPPLGWILLGGWAKLVPMFGSSQYAIASARSFALALLLMSTALLYVLGRRLALRRPFAVLAVVLFGLSPLAIHYQRMVLLDNIGVTWLLAALVLSLSPSRRLLAHAAAGACFACAVLTKETFVLFLPVLILCLWRNSAGPTRRFTLALSGSLFVLVTGIYALFATLRGELFPGAHHTSLAYGIHFQLTRPGGGSILDPHSGSRNLFRQWLHEDPILLVAALLLLVPALAIRRHRAVALGLLIPLAMVARPGSYVPAMYIIGILPFAALTVASVGDWLWRPRHGQRRYGRALAVGATAGAVTLVAALGYLAGPRWAHADVRLTQLDSNAPPRLAVDWMTKNADRRSRVLVDDTVWTDLVERGFQQQNTIWFYKLDLDPAIRFRWEDFDYVVRSNLLAGKALEFEAGTELYWLPKAKQVLDHSRIVAVFEQNGERIEIRRVIQPRPVPPRPRVGGEAAERSDQQLDEAR
jgi:4-amino-4-deoxy-L-arabinose transferase-like glycosyltransferase